MEIVLSCATPFCIYYFFFLLLKTFPIRSLEPTPRALQTLEFFDSLHFIQERQKERNKKEKNIENQLTGS